MSHNYLVRLDDACPTMDRFKWGRIEEILDKYCVKPLVGIIPMNEDPKQMIDAYDNDFWKRVHSWERKNWKIALHGYDHCYISDKGMQGLNPMWSRSEFAGVSLDKQREKIRKGVNVLREHGLEAKYFFAPSHTFDVNTLIALKEESSIRFISDTIGRYPYRKGDFWFIPQVIGHCVKVPMKGIYTFCFHPNTMNEQSFINLEKFLKEFGSQFVCFDAIDLRNYSNKKLFDRFLSCAFFAYRRFRGFR